MKTKDGSRDASLFISLTDRHTVDHWSGWNPSWGGQCSLCDTACMQGVEAA